MKKLIVLLLIGVFACWMSAEALQEDWRNAKMKTYTEVAAESTSGTAQAVPLATIGKGDYILGWQITPTNTNGAGAYVGLYDDANALLDETNVIHELETSQTMGTMRRNFEYPRKISNQLRIQTSTAGAVTEVDYIDADDFRH